MLPTHRENPFEIYTNKPLKIDLLIVNSTYVIETNRHVYAFAKR